MGDIKKTEKIAEPKWCPFLELRYIRIYSDFNGGTRDNNKRRALWFKCVKYSNYEKSQKKADKVNSYLKELCMKKNNSLIDHPKSIRQRRLNKSQLHLNSKWSTVLGPTFVNHLLNIFDWRFEKYYMDKMGCHKQHMSNSPYADIWNLFAKIT